MENIIDLDYKHAERIWKDFGMRNVSDYYDLCVKSDTLLLEDVIEILGSNVSKYMSHSQKSATFTVVTGISTMQSHIKVCNKYLKN